MGRLPAGSTGAGRVRGRGIGTGRVRGRGVGTVWLQARPIGDGASRAFRRRPGQAVAASETPGTRGFAGEAGAGTARLGRHCTATARRCRVRGRDGTGCRAYGERRHKDGTSMEETAQVRRVRGRDGTEAPGTSRIRHLRDGASRYPGRPVEPFCRIGPVSLHSKGLTNGTYVTSHEETWSSTRPTHAFHALPSGLARNPHPRLPPKTRPFRRRPQPARVASEMAASLPRPTPSHPHIQLLALPTICYPRIRDDGR